MLWRSQPLVAELTLCRYLPNASYNCTRDRVVDGLAVNFGGMHNSHFIGVLFYLLVSTNGGSIGELKRRRFVSGYCEQNIIFNLELDG